MINRIQKNILFSIIVLFLAACEKTNTSAKMQFVRTKTNTTINTKNNIKTNSNKNIVSPADMALVKQLANQFEESYKTGYKIKSETLDTIVLARLLRKNKELSVDDKITLIKSRKPSSMASKGAELALYLSELKRKDMTLVERARLLRNISSIYAQFYHPDKAIDYMKEVAEIYKKLDRKSDAVFAYECIARTFYNDKRDAEKALTYYEKALDLAKGLEEYDREWTQETILTLYAQQGKREKVKELYEKYSQNNPKAFEGIRLFLKYPGSKVNKMRCTIDILGDPSEIKGLSELRGRGNYIEIQKFLKEILIVMLESEDNK